MVHKAGIDVILGHLEGLIGPHLELSSLELFLIDRVFSGDVLAGLSVPAPARVRERKGLVACFFVDDRVPDGVEVANTFDAGVDPLRVATTVTLGVLVVDLGDGVKGLVKITHVVDNEAESERLLVTLVGESVLDLVNVGVAGRDSLK